MTVCVCERIGGACGCEGGRMFDSVTRAYLKNMSSHQRQVSVQLGRYICRIDKYLYTYENSHHCCPYTRYDLCDS